MRIKSLYLIGFSVIWLSTGIFFTINGDKNAMFISQILHICVITIVGLFYLFNEKFQNWSNKPVKLGYYLKLFFVYRINKFSSLMNYDNDKQLNDLINELLFLDIKKLEIDEYYIFINFLDTNNDITLNIWNRNKYYAWCSRGEFKMFNKTYKWDNKRPKRMTMAKLLLKIDNYKKEKNG